LAELEKKMAFYNPLRNVARVLRTDGVGDLPIPTTDDTGNTGALTAEAATTSATDITVSEVRLKAYTYRTLALCSNELLQDTGINIEAEINSLLAERIGRSEAAAFATGTGSSQPEGVVTGSSAGVTSASATAIALSDIVGLMGSLDWAYQTNAAFMMHQAIWFSILKLVDSQSRPLIADTINGNQPKLYGYPVIINNNMASTIATTNKTILFGDFSRFIIRDAGDFELRRLDELYANQYATGFLAVGRRDSKVLQSAAIKRLTQA
jgi:HK97 family phage major capsid protein